MFPAGFWCNSNFVSSYWPKSISVPPPPPSGATPITDYVQVVSFITDRTEIVYWAPPVVATALNWDQLALQPWNLWDLPWGS